MEPFKAAQLPGQWTLYDLRTLRYKNFGPLDSTLRRILDGYDLLGIMTHEAGHFLGLAHSDTKGAVMDSHTGDQWITRQELAERYGLPVKTPAQWASKGTGPRYARFGRHVRYRLSDVVDWEAQQFAVAKRTSA